MMQAAKRGLAPASHPLELIPLFRRWPVSHLRNVVYTGIWSGSLGLVMASISMAPAGRHTVHDRTLPRTNDFLCWEAGPG